MSFSRDLLKHSAIYGLGQVLARLASVILLPLYTRYLTPTDYGILSVIDLAIGVLAVVAAGGLAGTVNRFHFDVKAEGDRHSLWCTGMTMLLLLAVPMVGLAWVFKGGLTSVAIGPDVVNGTDYVSLALITLMGNVLANYQSMYLRALKRSATYLAITLPTLLLQIVLNILFIAFWNYGIYGFLISSLIAAYLQSTALFLVLFYHRPFKVEREWFRAFWHYGSPLIVASLSTLLMHQADRYLIRGLTNDLTQVGIYGLAYQLVHGVNALVLVPFSLIWSATMFEINHQSERISLYENIYKAFTLGVWLILLGLALFAGPIMMVLTTEQFFAAADLVPILCVGFFVFSLHAFYSVPAFIHKQTRAIAKVSAVAAIANIVCNLALIPILGVKGAALATVITYAIYSFYGHSRYRRVEKLSFPLCFVIVLVAYGVLLVSGAHYVAPPGSSLAWSSLVASIVWLIAASTVGLGPGRPYVAKGFAWIRDRMRTQEVSA